MTTPSKTVRWSAEQAEEWRRNQPWLAGFNYIPAYACNTTEWWQEESFDIASMDRELGWAADIGYNSTRVFIQYLVWKQNPAAFKDRFSSFLCLAEKRGISVMPVLFDDCAFGEPLQFDPFPGQQRTPIPGMILPSWTPSPGRLLARDPEEKGSLRDYVDDMLRSFGGDSRVLLWDLFNEPMNVAETGTPAFLEELFGWARKAGAQQPLSAGIWNDNQHVNEVLTALSDIITFHVYANAEGVLQRIQKLRKYGRPLVCTEWMARAAGSRFDTDLPIFAREGVGCYQWGLVSGRTQCRFPWSNSPGGAEDPKTGWFHDILHADGTPYRPGEVDVIKKILKVDSMKNL